MEVATPDPLFLLLGQRHLFHLAHASLTRPTVNFDDTLPASSTPKYMGTVEFHQQLGQHRQAPSIPTRRACQVRAFIMSISRPFLSFRFLPPGYLSFPAPRQSMHYGSIHPFAIENTDLPARCKNSGHSPAISDAVEWRPASSIMSDSTCSESDTRTGTGFHQSPCDQTSPS